MTENKKEQKESKELNANLQNEEIKLLGNKRERETTEENVTSTKICNCCKSSNSYIIEKEDSQTIFDYFSKETEFMNILKQNIENAISNNDLEINKYCQKCLINEFIKGGVEKIFGRKKLNENDNTKEQINETQIPNEWNKKIKELMAIYSTSLISAVKNIKQLKEEFVQIKNNFQKIFNDICIQTLLSKYKQSFSEIRNKIDINQNSFEETIKHFDNIINDLTKKEDMKSFFLFGVLNNDINQKNNLLKSLKQLQNEIENNTSEITEIITDKNTPEQKNEKEQQKKINPDMMLMNNNNDLLKNNLLSTNNFMNNGPNLLNSGLGILPLGIPTNPMNNLLLNPSLNPSILNQINNTINLNSMLSNMNNNPNDANKNMNNLNNLNFGGLNNLQGQNLNLNPMSTLETILYLRNILINHNNNLQTSNNNNLMGNLYQNQINPNFIPPIGLNNFMAPTSQMIPQKLNNDNSNSLNNNINSDENNANRKILMNREKNLGNINPNPNINKIQIPNLTNITNINSINNIKDMNNQINTKEINYLNEHLNNNINNINNMNQFVQGNPNVQNQIKSESLLKLFNLVAEAKEKNEKNNNNYSNNNAQK